MIRHWIEAMRLRTLPVSVAGVIAGTGCAILTDSFNAIPLLYLILHIKTWGRLKQSSGAAINPLLGRTAINLLIFALFFASICLLK